MSIEITASSSFQGTNYFGPEGALISAGFVKPEWLPGQPGRGAFTQLIRFIDGKAIAHKGNFKRDGNWIRITRRQRGFYEVQIPFDSNQFPNADLCDLPMARESLEIAKAEIRESINRVIQREVRQSPR